MMTNLTQKQFISEYNKPSIHDNNSGLFFVQTLDYWLTSEPKQLNNYSTASYKGDFMY